MNAIKPIETTYKGYRFRSRLEARWAVYFDALGLTWEYEPQGYELPSGPYLPDFWLAGLECWLEVKGSTPTKTEVARCVELAHGLDLPVALVSGLPVEGRVDVYCGDVGSSSGGTGWWEAVRWAMSPDGLCFDSGDGNPQREFFTPSLAAPFPAMRLSSSCGPDTAIRTAGNAAKAARFEHGETPRTESRYDELLRRVQTEEFRR